MLLKAFRFKALFDICYTVDVRTYKISCFSKLPCRFLPGDLKHSCKRTNSTVTHDIICRVFVKSYQRSAVLCGHFFLLSCSPCFPSRRNAVILTVFPPYPYFIGIIILTVGRELLFIVRNAVSSHGNDRQISAVFRGVEQIYNDLLTVVKALVAFLYNAEYRTVSIRSGLQKETAVRKHTTNGVSVLGHSSLLCGAVYQPAECFFPCDVVGTANAVQDGFDRP